MQDILLDDTELKITAGDFTVGSSDQQHQELLLMCSKGSFKEFPESCVGLWSYLEAENPAEMIAEVKAQFRGDGMEVISVGNVNGKLAIEAYYK